MNNNSLKKWRSEIDHIDDAILALIQKRELCALEIAKIKNAMSDDPQYYVPEREKEILDRIKKNYRGNLSDSTIKHIFQSIIKSCRLLQLKKTGPVPR